MARLTDQALNVTIADPPPTYSSQDQRELRRSIQELVRAINPKLNPEFQQIGVGAVVRPVIDKLRETISIRDFGAVGDFVSVGANVTDDTAAVQAALDAVYAAGGGIVKVPMGKYYITSGLHMYQSVQLIGDGGGKEDHTGGGGGGQTGTQFIFNPAAATTFLTVMRDPTGINPNSPTNAVCAAFGVHNIGPIGSDGIYFKNASFIARDVWIENFVSGRGFRVVSALNSALEQCMSFFNGWGFFMDPSGGLSTTVALRGVYCASNTVNYVVQNVLGFNADDQTISESPVTDGWQIDNATRVTLARVYNENVPGYVVRVGSQNNGATTDLTIEDINFQTGAANEITKDMIYIEHADGVRIRILNPPPERASIVRMTNTVANHKLVVPYGGIYTNQRATPGSGRANSHAYTKGTLFTAVCDDAITRTFIVEASGTSAGAQPAGYAVDTLNLADGSMGVSRYTTSTEYPVIDQSLGQLSGWTDEHQRRVIGSGAVYSTIGTEFTVAGWGVGVTATCSARDNGGRLSITSGLIAAANPTAVLTAFVDGPWTNPPIVTYARGDTSAPAGGYWALTAVSTSSLTFTFVGTPVNFTNYVLDWMVVGK
jgi:hypothetical protein